MDLIELAGGLISSLIDSVLFFTLLLVLMLFLFSVYQRKKYMELAQSVNADYKKVTEQEAAIKKLEEDLREYVMGGRSLRDWKFVKQQVDELSGLPSFTETDNEYLLRIHLSMTKKDGVRINGEASGIKLDIETQNELPLRSYYYVPKEINGSQLKVTYKGNYLEIVAPKKKS